MTKTKPVTNHWGEYPGWIYGLSRPGSWCSQRYHCFGLATPSKWGTNAVKGRTIPHCLSKFDRKQRGENKWRELTEWCECGGRRRRRRWWKKKRGWRAREGRQIKRKRKERRVGRKEGRKGSCWSRSTTGGRREGELSMFYVVRSTHTQTKGSCCGLFFSRGGLVVTNNNHR